ncbi:MAG: hypothetical protein ACM3N9_06345 [Syntrophothermus sp.]
MKTITTYIITAIFFLTGLTSFAMTPEFSASKSTFNKEINPEIKFTKMVPVVATFEDSGFSVAINMELPAEVLENDFDYAEFAELAPVTPEEAIFEETPELTSDYFSLLAPTTPSEATFDDAPDANAELSALAPVTPSEATFDDAPDASVSLSSLAPATPAEATFDDAPDSDLNITSLAPTTPMQADFEE